MPSTPQAPRVLVPDNLLEESRDAYSAKALLPGRHWLVEHIAITATGLFPSGVTVPAAMRGVITAWSADWAMATTAPVDLRLEVTVAGNAYAGTADTAAGTYVRQGPDLQLGAGAQRATVPNVLPGGAQLVTSVGAAIMWRIRALALTAPDVVTVSIWYHLIHSETLGCAAAP